MPDRRPEIDLLLACARTSLSEREKERIQSLLQRKMDWDYLLRAARNHGVSSLLYFHAKNFSPDFIPPAILDRLQYHCLTNAARNIYLTAELLRLLSFFEANGIPAVPFKGPLLASIGYGDLALREFSDLDILVRRGDVLKAKDLILSLGYRPYFTLPQPQEDFYIRSHTEFFFRHDETRSLVELQWEITPRDFIFSLDSNPLWERLESASLNGKKVWSFSTKDLIILLSLHGAVHCWQRLIWVSDLAEMMRVCGPADGKDLIDHAAKMGCGRFLLLALSLAHSLLEPPLPEKICERMGADRGIQSLAHRVMEDLFQGESVTGTILQNSLFYFRIDNRWRDRLSYCLRLFFTPTVTDWKSLPLPSWLFLLYFVFHPLRILGKYACHFLKTR